MEKKIYCFWTGDNKLPENRQRNLERLKEVSGCKVVFITPENLDHYLTQPLHPAYEFLSLVHKADYLRTYFMHFVGGGYSDIKGTSGSWVRAFEDLVADETKWINGYPEVKGGVAYSPGVNLDEYSLLVGNGAYICKPGTPLTQRWYREMIEFLDSKLDLLMQHPATDPRDHTGYNGSKYPIGWNELLGVIFHRVCYEYKDRLLQTLPPIDFNYYE